MIERNIHADSLFTSTWLLDYYHPNFVPPLEIIGVLKKERIRFVLVGTHGIGGWLQKPRATSDVDFLVSVRGFEKAVRALTAKFPSLQREESEDGTRLRTTATPQFAIDLIKPKSSLLQAALKLTHWVESGEHRYQIPAIEMAITMKYASLISESRGLAEQYLDAHDFTLLVKRNGNLDLKQLTRLGELVCAGGGQDLVEKVGDLRAGKKFHF